MDETHAAMLSRPRTTTPSRLRMSRLARREAIEGYLFILPWLLGLIIFTAGPVIFSLFLSLMKWNIGSPIEFVGLDNYIRLLTRDELFWQSLKVTSIYTFVSIPLGMAGSLIVALMMNQKIRGIVLFRAIYYLPTVISGVAVSMLWMWLFHPRYGLINWFLSLVGIRGPGWLASEQWALPALIVMSLWGVGGNMLIYLAGLQSIPTQLYEAAEIDGAGDWRKFWHITIPMISPVIFFNLIMSIIGSFQVFTQAYIMGGSDSLGGAGGPNYATLFYVLYLFRQAFGYLRFGLASAQAWILLVIILFFTLLVFRSSNAWVYYEGVRTRTEGKVAQ